MRKYTKKIKVLLLALIAVVVAGVPGFANTMPSSGVETEGGSIHIPVAPLLVKNDVLTSVAINNVEYTYTIEPATEAECGTVTDSNGHSAKVKPGDPTIRSSVTRNISYGDAELQASPEGTLCSTAIYISSYNSRYGNARISPGIYRFKITDTTDPDDLNAVGIERSDDYDPVLFLDIYLENATEDYYGSPRNVVKITGAVSGHDANHDGVLEKGLFEPDVYQTYNVELTKEVTGSMSDREHAFPFSASVVSPTVHFSKNNGERQRYIPLANNTSIDITSLIDTELVKKLIGEPSIAGGPAPEGLESVFHMNGQSYPTSPTSENSMGFFSGDTLAGEISIDTDPETGDSRAILTMYDYHGGDVSLSCDDEDFEDVTGHESGTLFVLKDGINASLKNGETLQIYGLPSTGTVSYTETNNTSDTYSVSVTGGTPSSATSVAPNETKTMPATDTLNAQNVKFTNNLDGVSPTGVVLRFGAPLLILAAAIALTILNKRAKSAK